MTPLTIKDVPAEGWRGKKALVRVDWNVPIAEGLVTNDFRIKATLPTLQFLQQAGASVTALTHLTAPLTKPGSTTVPSPLLK